MLTSLMNMMSDRTEYVTKCRHEDLAGITSHTLDSPKIQHHKLLNLQDAAAPADGDKTMTTNCPSSVDSDSLQDRRQYKKIAVRNDDGFFHCPWEGQPSCNHKPESLKSLFNKQVDAHLKPYRCRCTRTRIIRFSVTAQAVSALKRDVGFEEGGISSTTWRASIAPVPAPTKAVRGRKRADATQEAPVASSKHL
ncbi:uncharacterized protein LMH87_007715 [Akanthomyces muscarius]|uniref:Uncharacterized protein n=1 Tax=Akanthomyces muscarius TaxID=2231603 RepID=A0A9W8QLF7_AKAMU|nr:uncharacterized protein LMH87_007715 [Akanthomyces muscarius]KAJ4161691.1 hypothetical protein LMH87_007715 [Akanthomyces muscarius]